MGFDAFAKLDARAKAPFDREMEVAAGAVNERERQVARLRGRAGGVLPGMGGEFLSLLVQCEQSKGSRRAASHRIASHRIASHRIASHRIASHRIARERSSSRCARPSLRSSPRTQGVTRTHPLLRSPSRARLRTRRRSIRTPPHPWSAWRPGDQLDPATEKENQTGRARGAPGVDWAGISYKPNSRKTYENDQRFRTSLSTNAEAGILPAAAAKTVKKQQKKHFKNDLRQRSYTRPGQPALDPVTKAPIVHAVEQLAPGWQKAGSADWKSAYQSECAFEKASLDAEKPRDGKAGRRHVEPSYASNAAANLARNAHRARDGTSIYDNCGVNIGAVAGFRRGGAGTGAGYGSAAGKARAGAAQLYSSKSNDDLMSKIASSVAKTLMREGAKIPVASDVSGGSKRFQDHKGFGLSNNFRKVPPAQGDRGVAGYTGHRRSLW